MNDDTPNSYDGEFEDDPDFKSKTQLKKEMTELQELGLSLTKLKAQALDELPLTEKLRFAIDETHRIKQKNALKRHTQFIGKLMRDIDIDALQAVLHEQQERSHRTAKHKPYIEQWTNRLIEEESDALQAFIEQCPHVNIQKLRQLIRQAKKEHQVGKESIQRQKLFKLVRDEIAASQ